jgi:hypothetical protein
MYFEAAWFSCEFVLSSNCSYILNELFFQGRDLIIELFLYQKQYLNAIQTTCPWILRYLSTAVITNKSSRRNVMKDLIKAGLAIKNQPKKTT